MQKILNITNGDCAVAIMETANIPGEFLPWRDVLHDGPVPENLSIDELSQVRAAFISDRGWGTHESITQNFILRDNVLKSFSQYDKVILWFEHDLYDQLQILQLLDWFNQNRSNETTLSLICVDQYLGMLTAEEMAALFKYEQLITEKHFELADRAWSAFRADSPEKWYSLLTIDTTALPYLDGAVLRLLEEYPDCKNGLSRCAFYALKIISQGEKRPGRVFSHYQKSEERRFMGDAGFWVTLGELLASSPPLLKLSKGRDLIFPAGSDQELTITSTGQEVLSGARNWLEIVQLDRWIGGVHLTAENIWCWDCASGRIIKHSNRKNITD